MSELQSTASNLQASGPAQGNGTKDPADDRTTISRYFAEHGTDMMKAHQRWRNATTFARFATVVLGILLVAVPIILSWRENGGLSTGFWPSLVQRLDFFVPGVPLVVVGLVPQLWRFGWELPAGVLLLVFAGEMLLFQPDRPRMTVALSAAAIAAIIYGFYLRLRRRQDPTDLGELEKRVDTATGHVLSRAVEQALRDAPFPAAYALNNWQVLRTIPDRSRVPGGRLQSLLGSDRALRLTPLGFVAFNHQPHGLAVVEGAVDLPHEQVLFTRAQELSYSEILAMHWEQETPPEEPKHDVEEAPSEAARPSDEEPPAVAAKPHLSLSGLRAGLRKEARARHTDTLTIELAGNRKIVLLFQDSNLLGGKPGRCPIESIDAIRKVWTAISARRLPSDKPGQTIA